VLTLLIPTLTLHRWQCTVSGGRETRPLGAVELARAVQTLGAGEILLNCIDRDGAGQGFDLDLVRQVPLLLTYLTSEISSSI
jgi:glutamine amidotransferase/cyclase